VLEKTLLFFKNPEIFLSKTFNPKFPWPYTWSYCFNPFMNYHK